MNEKGFTLWFTGLHGSGKTTLAKMAEKEIRNRGFNVEILDGSLIRNSLSKGLGFGKEERDTHIRRMGFVCHLLSRNGVVAIASAISPHRAMRDENRKLIGSFVEVHVKCPVEICMKRDVKGLYKKAHDGEIKNFTGVSDPYEEPLNPEVRVETDKESPDHCLAKILRKLEELNYLPPKGEDSEEPYPNEEVYSIEDEDKIKKRLEDLGYI
jgi:adenylyl-sulfate kinase